MGAATDGVVRLLRVQCGIAAPVMLVTEAALFRFAGNGIATRQKTALN